MSVLSRFAADFQHPTPQEGYQRILHLKPDDHPFPVYSRSDIASILQRIQNSPPVVSESPLLRLGTGGSAFRGNSYRGRRGGWGENSRPYYRDPRGRGASFHAGPIYNPRGSQNTSYRGISGGFHGRGRGSTAYPASRSGDSSGEAEIKRQGTGTGEDPILID